MRVRSAAPPTSIRLPAIAAEDARALKDRRKFVSVGQVSITGGAQATVGGYIAAVAALLTHTVFYFPTMGLQAMVYLAWLTNRGLGRDLRDVRGMDTRARQAMSLRPWEYLTHTDLDQFLPSPIPMTEGGSDTTPRRGAEICFRFQRGACNRVCPYGRLHSCKTCGSPLHGAVYHSTGPTGPGHQAPPPFWARSRPQPRQQ